jgi:hypothetical protein
LAGDNKKIMLKFLYQHDYLAAATPGGGGALRGSSGDQ